LSKFRDKLADWSWFGTFQERFFLKRFVPFLILPTITFRCHKQKTKRSDRIHASGGTLMLEKLPFGSFKKFSLHEKRFVLFPDLHKVSS